MLDLTIRLHGQDFVVDCKGFSSMEDVEQEMESYGYDKEEDGDLEIIDISPKDMEEDVFFDYCIYAGKIRSKNEDVIEAAIELDIPADDIDEQYVGHYTSDIDFAKEHLAESMNIPDHLEMYIDWDSLYQDNAGDYIEENGYYFRSY